MSIDIAELRVLLNAADGRSDSPRMGHFGVRMAKVLPELLDELERLRTENEAWLTAASEAEFTGGTNRETRETMVAVGKGALEEIERLRRLEAAVLACRDLSEWCISKCPACIDALSYCEAHTPECLRSVEAEDATIAEARAARAKTVG